MAGRDPRKWRYRDIRESDLYRETLKKAGLHPAAADRILFPLLTAMSKDPTLANTAMPPTTSGSTDMWVAQTRRLNAADPVIRLYYTFDDEVVTLEDAEFQFPPESWRL